VVNEVTGLSLASAEREQAAGPFSVDLVAEDEAGNAVVIENQLERSDHDHLGKVLTYLVAFGAKTAVWIVSEPRPEHVSAVAWLNESTAASFYLLKLEAIRIGESPPAPLLTLIVGPSEEAREAGRAKQELAGRHSERRRFWTDLLATAKLQTSIHAGVSPGSYGSLWVSAGKSGLGYAYVVRKHDAAAELYIDRGKDSDAETKRIFDTLKAHQEEIEKNFGDALDWDWVEGRRGCRIRKTIKTGGYRDEERWPEIHAQMIDAMVRLEQAIRAQLISIRV
jgi:hypothetical protein